MGLQAKAVWSAKFAMLLGARLVQAPPGPRSLRCLRLVLLDLFNPLALQVAGSQHQSGTTGNESWRMRPGLLDPRMINDDLIEF